MQEYILVEQSAVKIEVQRQRNNWVVEKYFLGDNITFESLGLTLTVEELYQNIDNEEMNEWLLQKAQENQESSDEQQTDANG